MKIISSACIAILASVLGTACGGPDDSGREHASVIQQRVDTDPCAGQPDSPPGPEWGPAGFACAWTDTYLPAGSPTVVLYCRDGQTVRHECVSDACIFYNGFAACYSSGG